jgi:hypothetical protein
MLANMKKKLARLASEATFFNDEIKEKKALLAKVEGDLVKCAKERDRAIRDKKTLQNTMKSMAVSDMPQVLDYVNQKVREVDGYLKWWTMSIRR